MPMGLMSYLLFSGSFFLFLHDLIRISLNSFVSFSLPLKQVVTW